MNSHQTSKHLTRHTNINIHAKSDMFMQNRGSPCPRSLVLRLWRGGQVGTNRIPMVARFRFELQRAPRPEPRDIWSSYVMHTYMKECHIPCVAHLPPHGHGHDHSYCHIHGHGQSYIKLFKARPNEKPRRQVAYNSIARRTF